MAVRTWDISGNGFWDIVTNWSDDTLPILTDDVVINVDAADVTVTHRAGGTTINNLVVDESLTVTGGALIVQGTADLTNALTIGGGSATFNGSSNVAKLQLSGGILNGIGSFSVENFIWTGGNYSGSGLTVQQDGTLKITGLADKTFRGVLTNQGTATWDAGVIRTGNGAVWNNSNSSLFDIQNDLVFDWNTGTQPVINNDSVLRKSGGTGIATIEARIDNSGIIDVQSGTLRPTGNLTLKDGSQITGNGRLLANTGTLTVDGSISAPGTLEFGGGTLTGNGDIDNLTWTGGLYGANGITVREDGTLIVTGTTDKTFRGTLNNQGNAIWQAGTIRSGNGATWNNASTAQWEIQDNLFFDWNTGFQSIINNAGTLNKSNGNGTSTIEAKVNNSGTVHVQAGTLALTGGGTSNGRFQANSGTVLQLGNGSHILNEGATFTGEGTSQITNGSTTVNGAVTASGKLQLAGGLLNGTGLVAADDFIWTGGNYSGSGLTVQQDGTLKITGLADKTFRGVLTNQGTATWDAGVIRAGNGAIWNNSNSSLFDIQNDLVFDWNTGAQPVINNDSVLRKSGGTGIATIEARIDNSGIIDVQSGTLRPTGNLTLKDGSQITGNGRLLANTGTLTVDGSISAPGTLEFGGGTLIANNATIDQLTWTGGNYNSGALTLREDGTLSIMGLADKTFRGTFANQGDTIWQSGVIRAGNGAVWNNSNSSLFDIQNDLVFDWNTGIQPVINNDSVLRKSGGTGIATIEARIDNSGIIDVQSGTLRPTGNLTLKDGSQITGNGRLLANTGTLTVDGSISAPGTLEFGGGTLIANNATIDQLTWTGGNYNSGALTLREDGTLSIMGLADKTFRGTFANQGDTIWQSGVIRAGNGAVWNNSNSSLFDIQNDLVFDWNTGAQPVINNDSVLRKSGGTGIATIEARIDNSGIIDVQSGTLRPTGNLTLKDGSQITGNGRLLANTGTLTVDGSISAPGTLEFGGGTLTGNGDIDNLTWTGGLYGANGITVREDGTLIVTGTTDKIFRGTLNNQGNAIWQAGTIRSGNGATWNNASTAQWEIQDNLFFDWNTGSQSIINNAGTLNKSNGSGTSTIEAKVNNSGTVHVQAGTLAFTGGYTQLAGTTRLLGGMLRSSTPLTIQAGILDGVGTVAGNVSNAGVLNPGIGVGLLNLVGDYTQSATGTLNFDIGGLDSTEFDRLSIDGDANFNGTLNINFVDDYIPQLGDSFQVAAFDSFSGGFSEINIEGFDDSIVDLELEAILDRGELVLLVTQSENIINSITGSQGNDTLTGTTERDLILGNHGRDTILAGEGDDLINGGAGRDRLTGGPGSDRFIYQSLNDAGDIITDFEVGSDKIVLTELLERLNYQGTDPIADGYVGIRSRRGSSFVMIDADGAAGAGRARAFIQVQGVAAADLAHLNNFEV